MGMNTTGDEMAHMILFYEEKKSEFETQKNGCAQNCLGRMFNWNKHKLQLLGKHVNEKGRAKVKDYLVH